MSGYRSYFGRAALETGSPTQTFMGMATHPVIWDRILFFMLSPVLNLCLLNNVE